MKIQVIAIFYNAVQTVRRCIDSILNQEVGDNELEIIAIDDCSRDETRNILTEYDDKRVKKIFHEKNQGISAARNSGLRCVDGDAFFFIDGDDYLPSNALASLVSKWESDVDWVQGAYRRVNNRGEELGVNFKPDSIYSTHEQIEEHFNELEFIYTHNRLINSKWRRIYFPEGEVHEDRFWNVAAFPGVNNIVTISEPTYNYVVSESSFSSKSRASRRYMTSAVSLMRQMLDLPDCWSATRELFLLTTIYKNLFLYRGMKDLKCCWSQLDRDFKVSINMAPPFPRFPVSLYKMLSHGVPDVIILLYAKFYKGVKSLMRKPV